MRDALAILEGQRITVRGVIKRFGMQPGWGRRPNVRTVLLRPVVAEDGAFLSEHLWVLLTAAMEALHMRKGDAIELSGRVVSYERTSGGTDYKLVRPTRVRVVPAPELAQPEPDTRAVLQRRLKHAARLARSSSAHLERVYAAAVNPPAQGDWYASLLSARADLWAIDAALSAVRHDLAHLKEGASDAATH